MVSRGEERAGLGLKSWGAGRLLGVHAQGGRSAAAAAETAAAEPWRKVRQRACRKAVAAVAAEGQAALKKTMAGFPSKRGLRRPQHDRWRVGLLSKSGCRSRLISGRPLLHRSGMAPAVRLSSAGAEPPRQWGNGHPVHAA
jgi:hypothetical protein